MDNNIDKKIIPVTTIRSGDKVEVTADIHCMTIQVANICFVGTPGRQTGWVLVDAGMPRSADDIIAASEELFGQGSVPEAIILTHGHFDHVGALIPLAKHWGVKVYAHELEMPFLTGKQDYPEPDMGVEGGMVAKMSGMFPNDGIDIGDMAAFLPADGSVPAMPGWKWIYTPGHTPGHISLFRESDRALIAGDACVTVKQEYLYKVLTQEQEISGPPRYFTTDWPSARKSVEKLEALKPAIAVTGHGIPMEGKLLSESLKTLVENFDKMAIPDYGKYVDGQTEK
ncbi:MBL fold metallo-hydrolase [Peribacillus saganii]|uniref:MBL fold metallo-hydrolase n=1 Tax=Peribacillus saganii TaxID=2303992 RepID=A0A372LIY0_9BACI|nr:MBL fold metallo-hydrolase [Peribacillus saganii]RFU66357.1 MBL fold metallo-hydrolase [Peribacillus saganii]